MAKETQVNFKTVLLTTLIAIIPYTIINQVFSVINKNVSDKDYLSMKLYFAQSQPDYYPILFMFVLFFTVLAIVAVYSIICSKLPEPWLFRGLFVGIFLFLVADLPSAVHTGFTTVMPMAYAWGMALWGLAGNVVNGALIAYIYMKVTDSEKKK